MKRVRLLALILLGFVFFSFSHTCLDAQTTGTGAPGLRIDVTGSNDEGDFGVAIQLVVAMTILSLGPSVIMMMTCFTRMIIVLGFVRNAIGVNSAPSSQIIVGLALFLTFFVMGPVWNKIYDDAVTPYMSATMKSSDALMVATAHMKDFHDESNSPAGCAIFSRNFKAGCDDSGSITFEHCSSFLCP